jgi:hypothetical protein
MVTLIMIVIYNNISKINNRLKSLNTIQTLHVQMEIQILVYERHKTVVGLNRSIRYKLFPS